LGRGIVSRSYGRLIRLATARPAAILGLVLVCFIIACVGLVHTDTELIPTLSEGEFFFELSLPEGTSLHRTDRTVEQMEETALALPEIDRTYSTAGSRLVSGGLSLQTRAENIGQVHFVLRDRGDPELEERVEHELRDRYTMLPDLELKLGRPSYFTLSTPIEIILYAEDLELLRDYSLELAESLEEVSGLADVRSSLEAGNPEVQIIFDRHRIAALGLDPAVLTDVLRARVQGAVVTRFKDDDRQIDVRVRNLEAQRSSYDDIRRLVLTGPAGESIRLVTIADVIRAQGPAEIHRVQQQRAAVITAQTEGVSLGTAIERVRETIDRMPPPRGVDWELAGQNKEMEVSFQSLRFATVLAIFLVYLVMASIFESFLHPFLVLFTVPLGVIGVAAGLVATGTEISVIVLIGAVLLVGIIVNNAIVLIDAINRYRREGVEKREAIIRAGHVRLRPILMTTTTTILGLLPLAMASGEGAELRAPLAITVASGLFFGTVLTLVVIPAAYALVPSRVRPEEDLGLDGEGSTSAGPQGGARSEGEVP
ncbi:MAG TPA: efflux RND transporter permease subunit, partial [Planctomycetota bacterium]|nr:efflux RND transporter permease subunit [Planctomycetota bacterium]